MTDGQPSRDPELDLDDVGADVGVEDGDGTPAEEALARPSYHLERARSHVEKALSSAERETQGSTSFDVMSGVTVYVDDEDVSVSVDAGSIRSLDRDEALLLGQVLRVATEPERGAELLAYDSGVDVYHGP